MSTKPEHGSSNGYSEHVQKLHKERVTPKKRNNPFGNLGAPEVVLGYQLAEVLKKFCIDWIEERPNLHTTNFVGPVQYIAAQSGVNIRRVGGMCNGEYREVALHHADAILTAIGKNYMLATGEIEVVPNPRWSMEKWQEYMAERGCV